MMRITDLIKNAFSPLVTRNYTELPNKVKAGVDKYLTDGEVILLTLRNHRAIHKAPIWLDSNTFFNSWFILTNYRIIIARSSSEFKRFRDIPLNEISQISYELDNQDPKISITSPGKEDVIEFTKGASLHCEGMDTKLNEAMRDAKKLRNPSTKDSVVCNKCASKIPSTSKFCPECGSRIGSF